MQNDLILHVKSREGAKPVSGGGGSGLSTLLGGSRRAPQDSWTRWQQLGAVGAPRELLLPPVPSCRCQSQAKRFAPAPPASKTQRRVTGAGLRSWEFFFEKGQSHSPEAFAAAGVKARKSFLWLTFSD